MNDSQRLTYTHQTSDNNDVREYGGSENVLALTSGNYTKTTELQSDSFQIFSDWTDSFSTTMRYGMRTVDTCLLYTSDSADE